MKLKINKSLYVTSFIVVFLVSIPARQVKANVVVDPRDLIVKHALIGMRNTNFYAKQYSRELFAELRSNSVTLGDILFKPYGGPFVNATEQASIFLDNFDFALHHYVVKDLMALGDRVDGPVLAITEDATGLVASIDQVLINAEKVTISHATELVGGAFMDVKYISIALLDAPMPVNFSSNGSYLHNNLVAVEDQQLGGRVLGESTEKFWWQKLFGWFGGRDSSEIINVVFDRG